MVRNQSERPADRFFSQARWNKRKLIFWFSVGAVAAIVLSFIFSGNGIKHSIELRRHTIALEARNDSLARLNDWRKERISKLKSGDKLTLEDEARRRNMHYPGEKVYLINPATPDSSRKIR